MIIYQVNKIITTIMQLQYADQEKLLLIWFRMVQKVVNLFSNGGLGKMFESLHS